MTDQYFVRLWINRTDIPQDFTEEEGVLREVSKLRGYTPQGLIEKVQEMVPNLNAVEVKDGGCGIVAYLVDFENHG